MFESISIITNSDITNYNKIINTYNKLNPKKTITPANNLVTHVEDYVKSALSKINIKQIIDIPRGYNISKNKGYSLNDLLKKTNRIIATSQFFKYDNSQLNPIIDREVRFIDMDIYRIVKDPFSDLFIIRTKNKNSIVINENLEEVSSFNSENIFTSNQNWNNSIDISKYSDTILLTEGEELHLYSLSFKEKSIWILPNHLDLETKKHLKTDRKS